MRFSTGVILLGVASSAAATVYSRQSAYPDCALSCIEDYLNVSGCVAEDSKCLCRNAGFVANTTQCIETSCQGTNLTTSLSIARNVCNTVGVTLSSSASSSATTSATPTVSTTKKKSAASNISRDAILTLSAASAALAALWL